MTEIFRELESMAGNKIGSYLRHGGNNTAQLNEILESEFTVKEVEHLKNLLDGFIENNEGDLVEMETEFIVQLRQIKSVIACIATLTGTLGYQIENLPNLLTIIVQQQLQNVFTCYKTHHAKDITNMLNEYAKLIQNGHENTEENRMKFTENYLKSYFTKVVNDCVQSGAYKKYKVSVINRFQEHYEEMLAG